MKLTRKIKLARFPWFWKGTVGRCRPNGLVEVDIRQDEQEILNTLVHELLHWEFPDLSEAAVLRGERIAWELWKLGYRRVRE